MRHIHLEKLKHCNGTIVICKGSNANWLKYKAQDVLKAHGLGRKRAYDFNLILLGNEHDLSPEQALNQTVKKFKNTINESLLEEVLQIK